MNQGFVLPNVPVNEPVENQPVSLDAQWSRRRPIWMRDYISGDELSDDDIVAHLPLFVDNDPIIFDGAIKNIKWRKAMDAEI